MTKIYKTQQEVEADIKDGALTINGDVKFECSILIDANINARDINARDINAVDINAWDINAGDINAGDINAVDINAWDINTWDINARDISYHAFCNSYKSIKCLSIKGKRKNHLKPICLDGKLEIKQVEENVTIKISKKSLEALKDSGIEVIN